MTNAAITLQKLFREHFSSFASRYRLSSDMWRAAWCVMHCRTAELGGHVNSCPEGHYHSIAYNSCGHRSCPQCGWLDKEKWLAKTKRRLLPVAHHHLVFTVASELTPLWKHNRTAFADLLFAVVKETLIELLGDPKYLGARPGILAALHTWNQTLRPHVHLHCVVTAGGLDQHGRWLQPKKSCLLPRKVVMLKFRGKFLALLAAAIRRGAIDVPETFDLPAAMRCVRGKPWNVKVHAAYRHAEGVATYLAGYLKNGPIKNGRLLAVSEGNVLFRYRLPTSAGGDGKRQGVAGLPIDAFIGRWLQHVAPRRFQTVRGYGLYSANQHSRLSEARRALGVADPGEETSQYGWQEWLESRGLSEACSCPTCGRPLVSHHAFEPGRGPPLEAFGFKTSTVAA